MFKSPYTLITGASEGFGKALALECASRNLNLILVALPGSGLPSLAAFIRKNYLVDVVFFEHDLTNEQECLQLHNEVKEKKLAVNILINNAGMGGTHYFCERNSDFYRRQIELNVMAPTLLTHLFLDELQQNNVSHILNVSSMAGFFCLPKKQVYSGTKSYLLAFSRSLGRELREKNIFVSTVCPGGMNTTLMLTLQNRNLTGVGRWSVMNPDEVAKVAVDGMLQKKEIIIPGFWNRLFILLDKMLPAIIKKRIADKQMMNTKTYQSLLSMNFNFINNPDRDPKSSMMRKLSAWAKNHKLLARVLIITSFIMLTALGVFTGVTLGEIGFYLSPAWVPVVSCSFLIALVFYPARALKEKISSSVFYVRRKSCDCIMAASTFCLVTAISNQPDLYPGFHPRLNAATTSKINFPKDTSSVQYKSVEEFAASMKDKDGKTLKWKERKKLLKQQVKAIKKSNEPGPAGKVLLVLLSVLVALGLIYLVAALACGIACSGAETAAILVAVGGTLAVIFLLVLVIRAIYGKRKREKEFLKKERAD